MNNLEMLNGNLWTGFHNGCILLADVRMIKTKINKLYSQIELTLATQTCVHTLNNLNNLASSTHIGWQAAISVKNVIAPY